MASRNVNKVILMGNLTRDPELRYTPQSTAVANFTVATNRSWVIDGEEREAVDFHNVVAWGKLAEICDQLLQKGSKVYVEGRLQTRSWEVEDGSKRYKTEVNIDEMILLAKGKNFSGNDDDDSSNYDNNDSSNTSDSKDAGSSNGGEDDIDLDALLEEIDNESDK